MSLARCQETGDGAEYEWETKVKVAPNAVLFCCQCGDTG